MNPTVRQLRLFLSVAETGSFTEAAVRAFTGQPVLSRVIKDLERGLGVRLFDRTTRSVTLTTDGRALRDIAVEVLRSYDRGLGRFAAYRNGQHGVLTAAALPSLAAGLLPAVLADFLGDHPDVDVKILDGNTTEVVEHVRSGAADLAVTELIADDGELSVHPLRHDPMIAVLPPAHPLAEHHELTWTMLADEPIIVFGPGSSLRRLTDLAFAQLTLLPTRLLETRAPATAAGLVAAGLGVSAITETVMPLMAFASLETRPLTDPRISRQLAVVHRRNPPLPPPASEFMTSLRATALAAAHNVTPNAPPTH